MIRRLFILSLLWACAVSPSWAWVRFGFRGPGVGVYLGGPWVAGGPYYNSYYDDPYYGPPYYPAYPYPYYQPYIAVPVPAAQNSYQEQAPATPDNSRQDLKLINRQIARARNEADYAFDDGDISSREHDQEIERLKQIFKEARAEAKANDGYLTGDQERALLTLIRNGGSVSDFTSENGEASAQSADSDRKLKKINDQIAELRSLLDKKTADGDITKAQASGMREYLSRLEKQVHSDASANDGTLTQDQDNAVLQQLSRAKDSITQNFVVQ